MIKPLLYLLHKGRPNSATRHKVTEDLLTLAGVQSPPSAARHFQTKSLVIMVDLAHVQAVQLLASAIIRHPQLAHLEVRLHGADMTVLPESVQVLLRSRLLTNEPEHGQIQNANGNADLWVCTHSTLQGMIPALKAMAGGVPVLVPDTLSEHVLLMRDGVNGFLYRADDPDSLALSLLTLQHISKDLLRRVALQARQTLSNRYTEMSAPCDAVFTGELP